MLLETSTLPLSEEGNLLALSSTLAFFLLTFGISYGLEKFALSLPSSAMFCMVWPLPKWLLSSLLSHCTPLAKYMAIWPLQEVWLFSSSPDYNSLEYLIVTNSLGDLDYYLIVIWDLDYISAHVGALHMRYCSPRLCESCTMTNWYLRHVPLHDLLVSKSGITAWLIDVWVMYHCMTNQCLSHVPLHG